VVTIDAAEFDIPPGARDALERGESVVVLDERGPTYVILSTRADAEERSGAALGRPVRQVFDRLSELPPPDPDFAGELEAIMQTVGPTPPDPWASS